MLVDIMSTDVSLETEQIYTNITAQFCMQENGEGLAI